MASPTVVRFNSSRSQIANGDSRKELRVMAAEVALNKMFSVKHFDICAVREACEALGATLTPDAEAILRPLHCVNWDQIPPAIKDEIPHLLKESFQRSQTIRGMVQDIVLGDFAEKEPEVEVIFEKAKEGKQELITHDTAERAKEIKKKAWKWW